jgi:histidine ammonia-lyase
MGATAVLKLRTVGNNLETIIAIEAFCAAQGIDLRKKVIGQEKNLGIGTRRLYQRLRASIPFIERDEYMKVHLDSAVEVVRNFSTIG